MPLRKYHWKIAVVSLVFVIVAIVWLEGSPPKQVSRETPGGASLPESQAQRAGVDAGQSFPGTGLIHSRENALAYEAAQVLQQWQSEDTPGLREERSRALDRLLQGADLQAVLDRLPPDVLGFALGLPVFQSWMDSQPAAAADWMSRHPDIPETRIASLVQDWEETDGAALKSYLDNLPSTGWKEEMLTVVARDSAAGDPVQAIEWADELQPGPVQTGLLQEAVGKWAQKDSSSAMSWVSQVTDPRIKDQLIKSVAVEYARTDPTGAADYLLQSMRSNDLLDSSIPDIASVWAQQEPAAAAAWIQQLPDSNGQHAALAALINVWSKSDPNATIAWVNQLPQSTLRGQAVSFLAETPSSMPASGQ